jgi:hypothetical protein
MRRRLTKIGRSYFNPEDLALRQADERDIVQIWEGFFQGVRVTQV